MHGWMHGHFSLKHLSCGDVLLSDDHQPLNIHNIHINTHRRNGYAYIYSTTMHTDRGMASLKHSTANLIHRSSNIKDSCVNYMDPHTN